MIGNMCPLLRSLRCSAKAQIELKPKYLMTTARLPYGCRSRAINSRFAAIPTGRRLARARLGDEQFLLRRQDWQAGAIQSIVVREHLPLLPMSGHSCFCSVLLLFPLVSQRTG